MNKKKVGNQTLLFVCALLPFLCRAQGVNFEQWKSWQQILAKAKQEHKYIFVDCYATWCGPCKRMDREVYPAAGLADYMNPLFISVKVQVDTSKTDNEGIQGQYADAQYIKKRYQITAMPTFLFFDEDGKIVDRELGFKPVNEMLAIAKAARLPESQYYQFIERYQNGDKNYPELNQWAIRAKEKGYLQTADSIAADYLNNYLVDQPDSVIYTRENLDFILNFARVIRSYSKVFRLLYPDGRKIDQANGAPVAESIVDFVVLTNEYIKPAESLATESKTDQIDWEKIGQLIRTKYGKIHEERILLRAKALWYQYIAKTYDKDWAQYIDFWMQVLDKSDSASRIDLFDNNFAFSAIFFHCDDMGKIEKIAEMQKGICIRNPSIATFWDTYAELLYKLGKQQEAITIEEKAVQLEKPSKNRDTFISALDKMRKGQITWNNP